MIFRPNTWDHNIFDCINKHNEYRLPDQFFKEDVIVDIGAHIGSFTYACLTRGAGKVYAFEALDENYALARENLARFGGRAMLRFGAVWRSDVQVGNLQIKKSTNQKNTGGNGVRPDCGGMSVPAILFDEIIQDAGSVRFLKLDCEGAEFPILLTSKRLGQVQQIAGEYHQSWGSDAYGLGYEDYTRDLLGHVLRKNGFNVTFKESTEALGFFFAVR